MPFKFRVGLFVIAALSLLALAAVTQIDYNTQIKNIPLNTPQKYNFLAQFPGGSLASGNNTITMTPVPVGVNGTDSNHYLYVSGGTGTAEACLISGGSGTSGQSSGSIIINCANSHTGAWSVQSATSGAQEDANINPTIYFPDGTYNFYSPLTLAGDATLTCASNHAILTSQFATQNLIVSNVTTVNQRFAISNCQLAATVTKTAGDGIQINGSGSVANTAPFMSNLTILGQWNGIHAVSADRVMITNVRIYGNINIDVWLSDSINVEAGDGFITSSVFDNSVTTGTAIKLDTGAALKLIGNKVQNHNIGLDVEVPDGTNQSQLLLSGNSFDFSHTNPILMQRSGTTGNVFGGSITGNYIGGDSVAPNCLTLSTGVNTMIVSANYFQNCATAGVAITGTATSVQIQGNFFNSSIPTGVTIGASAGTNQVTDNRYGNTPVSFSVATEFSDHATSFSFATLPTNVSAGSHVFCFDCNAYCSAGSGSGTTCFRQNSTWAPTPFNYLLNNFIATETGANNAIAGCLTGVPLTTGLLVNQVTSHTLQIGANTYAYCGGAAVAIKSRRNTANNIATGYATASTIGLLYDGASWEDISQ